MVTVTICGDFEAQENKVSHYFHRFPICSLLVTVEKSEPSYIAEMVQLEKVCRKSLMVPQ